MDEDKQLDKGESEKDCGNYRNLLDKRLDHDFVLSDEEDRLVDAHLEACTKCSAWYRHTASIIETVKVMPQFDVSENLTQNILASVAKEEIASQRSWSWVVYATGIFAAMWVLLIVDGYETIWGVGSWILGLLTLVALKFLIADTGKKHQVVER
jgi:hypothetical protein